MDSRYIDKVSGRAVPLRGHDIDTDRIIPARFLKCVSFEGLETHAFEDDRKQLAERGVTHAFSDPKYAGAGILLVNGNFGCGSSREHAAWALLDMGVKAVIAPSFSDIFAGNAFKNGILTVALPQEQVDRLLEVARTDPIGIDLESQVVTTPFQDRFSFEIDPFRKDCLMGGLDEVGLTLARDAAIGAYEARHGRDMPWFAQGTEIAA
jgi:3-isopropylmalate/(R)-2-methylmalate dehydratase small subunit